MCLETVRGKVNVGGDMYHNRNLAVASHCR